MKHCNISLVGATSFRLVRQTWRWMTGCSTFCFDLDECYPQVWGDAHEKKFSRGWEREGERESEDSASCFPCSWNRGRILFMYFPIRDITAYGCSLDRVTCDVTAFFHVDFLLFVFVFILPVPHNLFSFTTFFFFCHFTLSSFFFPPLLWRLQTGAGSTQPSSVNGYRGLFPRE